MSNRLFSPSLSTLKKKKKILSETLILSQRNHKISFELLPGMTFEYALRSNEKLCCLFSEETNSLDPMPSSSFSFFLLSCFSLFDAGQGANVVKSYAFGKRIFLSLSHHSFLQRIFDVCGSF